MVYYNKSNSFDENDDKAKFNEAMFQMRRLNSIQDTMNIIRSNMLTFNEEYNEYNYKLFFNNACSLLNEVWAKLDEKEREESEKIRILLIEALENLSPYKKKVILGKEKVILDKKNWVKIENVLITFERSIKVYLDNHGLTNPTDYDEGL